LDSLLDTEFSAYPFPVFEVPLEKLTSPEKPVPHLVRATIKYLLNENAILTQGLFRMNGSTAEIQMYRKLIDEGKEINFSKSSYYDVAGLLKEFFRRLPEPLIPHFYNEQVRNLVEEHRSKDQDEAKLLSSIKYILQNLPTENFSTLKLLIHFLFIFVSYSHINKMNIDNIIRCIVPSIQCIPAIFYYSLTHFEFFFGDQVTTEITDAEKKGRGRREGNKFNCFIYKNNITPPPNTMVPDNPIPSQKELEPLPETNISTVSVVPPTTIPLPTEPVDPIKSVPIELVPMDSKESLSLK